MINSKELRQGNILKYGAHGAVVVDELKASGKVRAVFTEKHSIDLGYLKMLLHPGDLDPIALTSEIIGKCKSNANVLRYEVRLNKMVIEIDDLQVEISTPELIDGIRESSSFAKVPVIEYLHQLQNLFFALTGQELEVKL